MGCLVAPSRPTPLTPRSAYTQKHLRNQQNFIHSIRRKGKGSLHNYSHQCLLSFATDFYKSLILEPTPLDAEANILERLNMIRNKSNFQLLAIIVY